MSNEPSTRVEPMSPDEFFAWRIEYIDKVVNPLVKVINSRLETAANSTADSLELSFSDIVERAGVSAHQVDDNLKAYVLEYYQKDEAGRERWGDDVSLVASKMKIRFQFEDKPVDVSDIT